MHINKKIIIFDLDGVLVDSIKNMSVSWDHVKKKNSIKVPFKLYKKYIGYPFYSILKKLKIKNNYKNIKNSYDSFSNKKISKIKLYPNVKKTLRTLSKNYVLAVITSKDKFRTNRILKKFNLSFKYVFSPSKHLKPKPHPIQILKILKKEKIKKKNCFYVGDMKVDSIFAKNAGVKFIFAMYGYETKKIKTKFSIQKFKNLEKIV